MRAPVEPQIGKASIMSYLELPKVKDCFIQAAATEVAASQVTLSNGQHLPYDYLILAFGTSYVDKLIYSSSGSVESRRSAFQVRVDASNLLVCYGITSSGSSILRAHIFRHLFGSQPSCSMQSL